MVQVGLALMVSDEVHNAMRRLQLDLAEACGGNPALRLTPHITLKQPFHARELAPIENYFDELASGVALGEVSLRGIGYFDDESEGVAYADVVPDPALERLRRRILTDLAARFRVTPGDVEDDHYHFHATLAYHLSSDQVARARAALADVTLDLHFTPERLALFYYTGDLWIVYRLARLGPAPTGRG
jgi:2'-5' RNA ligase